MLLWATLILADPTYLYNSLAPFGGTTQGPFVRARFIGPCFPIKFRLLEHGLSAAISENPPNPLNPRSMSYCCYLLITGR